MKNKRRKFLKNAGSTALFASLGSSFFLGTLRFSPLNSWPSHGFVVGHMT